MYGIIYYPIHNKRKDNNMIQDKTFRITFKKSNGETVTRFGKWDSKCRYWTSKIGSALITYFDLDKKGYRTAKGSWKVRF